MTGEIAIGWAERNYVDPRLNRLQGLLTTASLVWTATPLTTAKFFSDTQLAETTLPGTSGILVRTYTFEVDHDFRRWLTGIGKFTYGTLDYQGDVSRDKTYSLSGDLIYKMNRNIWIKGTLRQDWLDSNVAGRELEVDGGDGGGEAAALTLTARIPWIVIPRESGVSSTPRRLWRRRRLWNTGSPAFAGDDSDCPTAAAPSSPSGTWSIARAHRRPSRIAQTTSDWPRRMSPAENTFGSEVL